MNYKIQKLCAWSGVVAILLMAYGFAWLAGFIPPTPPSASAEQVAKYFVDHRDSIRIGMILSMVAAGLMMPFVVVISIQMRRIEGRYAPLSYIQLGSGALLVLEFIYLIFFWQTATFRVDRSPELILLLNDMAWIPFVGLSSTLILQSAVFGFSILLDSRVNPVFPRWLGYFNLYAAVSFIPGSFNVFFMNGPMAWDGLLAFYYPIPVFVAWMFVNSWGLLKAVDHQLSEEADIKFFSASEMSREIVRLGNELSRLSKRLK